MTRCGYRKAVSFSGNRFFYGQGIFAGLGTFYGQGIFAENGTFLRAGHLCRARHLFTDMASFPGQQYGHGTASYRAVDLTLRYRLLCDLNLHAACVKVCRRNMPAKSKAGNSIQQELRKKLRYGKKAKMSPAVSDPAGYGPQALNYKLYIKLLCERIGIENEKNGYYTGYFLLRKMLSYSGASCYLGNGS